MNQHQITRNDRIKQTKESIIQKRQLGFWLSLQI